MRVYVVSWLYNGREFSEEFPSFIQAQVRYWKLGDNNSKSLTYKEVA